MFNSTEILIEAFIKKITKGYRTVFGRLNPQFEDILGWAGGMSLEIIANSDALYHNVEHTMLVCLVGQEILRGKNIHEKGVTSEDWMHYVLSLLCHDIGYIKGVCLQDKNGEHATGKDGRTITLKPGSTDAALTPYHVDRAKLFIDERFKGHPLINAEKIKMNIELTKFPVPSQQDSQAMTDYPGMVRAADLIGQLSDPRYLKKIAALFYEFEETGTNAKLGYKTPGDLRDNYPKFYWSHVFPYVKDSLQYLSLTQSGHSIVSTLFANVFTIEHEKIISPDTK